MNVIERLLYGGQVMLIGLIIVFAVLLLLILVISLLSAAIRKMDGNKDKPQQSQGKTEKTPVQAPVMQAMQDEAPVVEAAADNTELMAVIAAALASFDNSNKLIVRSVRRVSGWKNANRAEQVSRF